MIMCANVGDRGGAHICHLQKTMFGSLFSSFTFKWIPGIRLDHQEYAAIVFSLWAVSLWLVLQTNKQKTRDNKLVSNNDVIDFWVMCLECGFCSVAETYLHRLERPRWFLALSSLCVCFSFVIFLVSVIPKSLLLSRSYFIVYTSPMY